MARFSKLLETGFRSNAYCPQCHEDNTYQKTIITFNNLIYKAKKKLYIDTRMTWEDARISGSALIMGV